MKFFLLPGLIIFCVLGLGIGFLLVLNPAFAIEIQRRFYAKINWRLEPISLPKEIRNTRLMGIFLIILLAATAILMIAALNFTNR